MLRAFLASSLALALWACGSSADQGPIGVAIIGEEEALFDSGVRLSFGAQHLRAASYEGLVALDAAGQVVPAIAERWIVTDDGLSYIFRLRNSSWQSADGNGEPIRAVDIRRMIQDKIRQLEGTSLGLDLAKVMEVRAMTGRVIEIRLSGPMPQFLRLLAQPELGLSFEGQGAGPMGMERPDDVLTASLSMLAPESRGLPAREDWAQMTRKLAVRNWPFERAMDAFASGEVDLLMNGSLAEFPLIELGPLSRGAIQLDPALGLFGLMIRSDSGLLADPERREALSMAIDREALIQPLGLGGWSATTWIVPPDQFTQGTLAPSRWPNLDLEQRRAVARQRIANWSVQAEGDAIVRVGLPEGPGGDILFRQLAAAFASIGVQAERVAIGEGAELELRDRLARYSSPRWYLNQLNCTVSLGLCSEDADALVRSSIALKDTAAKQELLIEAHSILTQEEVFIPFGAPVRWSLVRGSVDGYQANPWGLHPLSALAGSPN